MGRRPRPAEHVHAAAQALSNQRDEYAQGQDRPVGGYTAVTAAYGLGVAALAGVVKARGVPLPDRVGLGDLALVAVATHKLARRLAKDPVTSPLRVPFTRFEGRSGESELAESPRGAGLRHAVGELVTCPFCLSQWLATGFLFGLVLAPRPSRLVASVLAAMAGADALQFAYDALQERTT